MSQSGINLNKNTVTKLEKIRQDGFVLVTKMEYISTVSYLRKR